MESVGLDRRLGLETGSEPSEGDEVTPFEGSEGEMESGLAPGCAAYCGKDAHEHESNVISRWQRIIHRKWVVLKRSQGKSLTLPMRPIGEKSDPPPPPAPPDDELPVLLFSAPVFAACWAEGDVAVLCLAAAASLNQDKDL